MAGFKGLIKTLPNIRDKKFFVEIVRNIKYFCNKPYLRSLVAGVEKTSGCRKFPSCQAKCPVSKTN